MQNTTYVQASYGSGDVATADTPESSTYYSGSEPIQTFVDSYILNQDGGYILNQDGSKIIWINALIKKESGNDPDTAAYQSGDMI